MPKPIEVDDLHGYATLFELAGRDDEGEAILANPRELRVKWDKVYKQAKLSETETVTIMATVVVDQDVPLNSLLWEGRLTDWYGTGSDDVGGEMMQVILLNSSKDVKYRNTRRTLELCRYRDRVP
jgi:hypothetical protein